MKINIIVSIDGISMDIPSGSPLTLKLVLPSLHSLFLFQASLACLLPSPFPGVLISEIQARAARDPEGFLCMYIGHIMLCTCQLNKLPSNVFGDDI